LDAFVQKSNDLVYTGVPAPRKDPKLNQFWTAKLAAMGRANIHTFTRPLKYGTETVTLSDGSTQILTTKQEKGIDVRLALDIVRLALDDKYDFALIFSQDQDPSEVADELKSISILQNRWISAFSAFPASTVSTNGRGINRTTWIKIDKTLYDSCIDTIDYRTKK